MQVEGAGGADWVLIDAGDIVVHLFKPEARTMYALEKMWGAEPGRGNVSGLSVAGLSVTGVGAAGRIAVTRVISRSAATKAARISRSAISRPIAITTALCRPAGEYSLAGVGPNSPRVGAPAAAARCIRPESLPTNSATRARQAATSGSD